jgi:pyruvate,water dikinase
MKFIRHFSDIGLDDVPQVGGKNASLGELYRALAPGDVNVPDGFAVTAEAYRETIQRAGLTNALHAALDGVETGNLADLAHRAARARDLVRNAPLPDDLAAEIVDSWRALRAKHGPELAVAVRSSATAEDLPSASFAGQHESFLNVRDEVQLLNACHRCFANLFTDRAVRYRIDQGFDHFRVALSIGVMKMVRSDLAASGVIFTLDTESGFRDVVFITAAYGLGENVVQGTVDPDEFYVFKPTFLAGRRIVLRRRLGGKAIRRVYADVAGADADATRNVATAPEDRARFSITDEEALTLADYALRIEAHYSAKAGEPRPTDIEWAKDGLDGKLYCVQARPETAASLRAPTIVEQFYPKARHRVLVTGRAVGARVASGRAHLINNIDELVRFKPGEVLVAESTMPDWSTVMKTAAAIVTNRGGRTCHAAIVARELGIPAVIGAAHATERLVDGAEVTVSCAEGDTGKVYAGLVEFDIERTDTAAIARPRTQIMINLGDPELAFKTSFLPNDGIGLARMEFIIQNTIGAHPMALAHPERIPDADVRAQILQLATGYASPADYFISRLAEGVGTIAAAFYPKPVIVRLSDFKSNEYASLAGGRWFEPQEANPMLGFRGAARYAHPAYAAGFALECAAMRRVREDMGLTNVRLMVPFCRRISEAEQVLRCMAELGLARGSNGLEIYIMCEIPNNVVLIDRFARHFDGFSIGSNDLTQLALGVDRESEIVAFDYDERDEGVLDLIRQAVEGCRRNGRHSGICG